MGFEKVASQGRISTFNTLAICFSPFALDRAQGQVAFSSFH